MLDLPEDTERLIKALADKSGRTPEKLVRDLVEAEAHRAGVAGQGRRKTAQEKYAAIVAISEHVATLPVLDDRAPDEIIGYDEFGLPR